MLVSVTQTLFTAICGHFLEKLASNTPQNIPTNVNLFRITRTNFGEEIIVFRLSAFYFVKYFLVLS